MDTSNTTLTASQKKRQNFSKKRQAILETIRNTTTHPTAEWVYQTLKPEYPDLSLGTVYRNIAAFKKEGLICRAAIVNGQERLDGNLSAHSHFICKECGAVLDLYEDVADPARNQVIEQNYQVEVEYQKVVFYGKCSACKSGSAGLP